MKFLLLSKEKQTNSVNFFVLFRVATLSGIWQFRQKKPGIREILKNKPGILN